MVCWERTMKLVLFMCLLNYYATIISASPPTNFFLFGRDVPYDLQYNNPHKNYHTPEGREFLCLVLGICTTMPFYAYGMKPRLHVVHEWKQLEFDYPTEQDRQNAIDSGDFVEGIPAPIDVDVQYGQNSKRIFVAIPRFQPGNPVTLTTISNRSRDDNPILIPYPSWDWHTNPTLCKPDRLISVYRVHIDECNRMWVLDTGRFGALQTCRPQIIAFDLNTDSVLYKYEIPEDQLESRSILVTPIADVRDPMNGCTDTLIYVADCQTYSLIVYDPSKGTSWRITDKTMYPFPDLGTYHIAGEQFELMDGILGMTLSKYIPGHDRILYYHSLTSATENFVNTKDIRNSTRFEHDPTSSPEIFHTYSGRRNSQSAGEAMDSNGIIYFGQAEDLSLNCWNTDTEYGKRNIDTISQDAKLLQFLSAMKVIPRKNIEELWTISMRLQKVFTGSMDRTETNFRILAGKTTDLIENTKCRRRTSNTINTNNNNNAAIGGGGPSYGRPKYFN